MRILALLESTSLTPEVFEYLQNVDWVAIGKSLLVFTIWRAQIYRWRSGDTQDLALGKTPEDIVQEVIEKTISGERQWDPSLGPLVPWLKDQVKSILDALYKSAANRYEYATLTEDPDPDPGEPGDLQQAKDPRAVEASIPGLKEQVEKRFELDEQINQVFTVVNAQPELEEIVVAILDGCEAKPRYLAEKLGVPISEINNRLKRLRRKVINLEKSPDE